jgi:hypothetical protein
VKFKKWAEKARRTRACCSCDCQIQNPSQKALRKQGASTVWEESICSATLLFEWSIHDQRIHGKGILRTLGQIGRRWEKVYPSPQGTTSLAMEGWDVPATSSLLTVVFNAQIRLLSIVFPLLGVSLTSGLKCRSYHCPRHHHLRSGNRLSI